MPVSIASVIASTTSFAASTTPVASAAGRPPASACPCTSIAAPST
jgi:hypothetical protein